MRHFSLKKRLSTLLLSAIIAVSAFAMPVSAAEVDTLSTSEKSSVPLQFSMKMGALHQLHGAV